MVFELQVQHKVAISDGTNSSFSASMHIDYPALDCTEELGLQMKSIDTYLCRNTKKPVVEFYDMNTNQVTYSDGSRQIVCWPRETAHQAHERLSAENPKVLVIAKASDGLWLPRLVIVIVVGWIIFKGVSS
jgi:hypothetical protein